MNPTQNSSVSTFPLSETNSIATSLAEDETSRALEKSTARITSTILSTTTSNAVTLTTLTWKNLTVEAWTAISVLAFIGLWITGLLLRFVVYVIKKRFQEKDRPKSVRAKAKIVSFVDDKQIKVELDRV